MLMPNTARRAESQLDSPHREVDVLPHAPRAADGPVRQRGMTVRRVHVPVQPFGLVQADQALGLGHAGARRRRPVAQTRVQARHLREGRRVGSGPAAAPRARAPEPERAREVGLPLGPGVEGARVGDAQFLPRRHGPDGADALRQRAVVDVVVRVGRAVVVHARRFGEDGEVCMRVPPVVLVGEERDAERVGGRNVLDLCLSMVLEVAVFVVVVVVVVVSRKRSEREVHVACRAGELVDCTAQVLFSNCRRENVLRVRDQDWRGGQDEVSPCECLAGEHACAFSWDGLRVPFSLPSVGVDPGGGGRVVVKTRRRRVAAVQACRADGGHDVVGDARRREQ